MGYIGNDSEYKASSKEYLLALSRFSSFIKLLNASNKPYDGLLSWLLKNEKDLISENKRLPAIKDIAKNSGIEAAKVAKHLKAIYDDIIELNWNEPHKFVQEGQIMCYLHFHYIQYGASFILGLNNVPSIGSSMTFWFIKPKTGGSTFHVRSMGYEIENSQQIVTISLTSDEDYLYLRLLREKAYLSGDISAFEYINMRFSDDLPRANKLIKMYQHL